MSLIPTALRKLYFYFLWHWMGYDHGDSFPFDCEPNGIPFGSKSKGKLSPWSYPIQCERNWKYCFLSAAATVFSVLYIAISRRLISVKYCPFRLPSTCRNPHELTLWILTWISYQIHCYPWENTRGNNSIYYLIGNHFRCAA